MKLFIFAFILLNTQVQAALTSCGAPCTNPSADICRINNGQVCDITTTNTPTCQQITNSTGSALMVPAKTDGEWDAFLASSGVGTAVCGVNCYTDSDNDNYAPDATITVRVSCGAGWVLVGGESGTNDCCDTNANVKPGQASYFSASIPAGCGAKSGTYDYNCSSSDDINPSLNASNGRKATSFVAQAAAAFYFGGCDTFPSPEDVHNVALFTAVDCGQAELKCSTTDSLYTGTGTIYLDDDSCGGGSTLSTSSTQGSECGAVTASCR